MAKVKDEGDDDDDPLAWLLGPKVARKKLSTEPLREPSKEQRVAALGVALRKETAEDKAKRQREKEEFKQSRMSEEEKQKKARVDKELADTLAFLEAVEAEERRQQEDRVLVRDGSEKPSISSTWKRREEEQAQAADEARADRADASLDLSRYFTEGLFPVEAIVQYVTRNGRLPLRHCEFAIITKSESVWRHKHFPHSDMLRQWLADKAPARLEIGPWHMEVSKVSMGKEPYSRLPVQRYLAFDVDMCTFEVGNGDAERDGYVRKCRCRVNKNGTCSYGCWFYMRVAVKVPRPVAHTILFVSLTLDHKVLTYLMRKCFGAKEVLAIYSGNRGVHVMCLDEVFVGLSANERGGIVKRIKLFGDPLGYYLHPEFTPYIYEYILKPAFYDNWLDGQVLILESHTTLRMLVLVARVETAKHLPSTAVPTLVKLSHAGSRAERVEAWLELCLGVGGAEFERLFIFRAMFPRLDEGVTIRMDHLLKAPFVIHPSTRRCSVPIPDIDEWLPHMAPRASEVIPLPPDERIPEWMRNKESRLCGLSLAPYVQHLAAVMHRAYPIQIGQPFDAAASAADIAEADPTAYWYEDGPDPGDYIA